METAPFSILHSPFSRSRNGLTLIEILVVLGIIGLLAVFLSNSLANFGTVQALQTGSGNAASLIRRAQEESLVGAGGVAHGVHIASTTLTLFSGSSYIASSTANQVLYLAQSVNVASTTIAGGGADIIFDQLIGTTREWGSIVLQVGSNSVYRKTIIVSGAGIVSIQ